MNTLQFKASQLGLGMFLNANHAVDHDPTQQKKVKRDGVKWHDNYDEAKKRLGAVARLKLLI